MIRVQIRPIRSEDIPALYAIRQMEGVRENTLALPSVRLQQSEEYFGNFSASDHAFVAEIIGKKKQGTVIGSADLSIASSPRCRHSAEIGIMVHKDYQGEGVGRRLMEALIDLADNWLKLVRLELNVFADNLPAVKLYESLGFVVEGTKKYGAIKEGHYGDLFLMARYNV